MFRFFQLRVYELAKDFYREIILITKIFPNEFLELKIQLRRAALSIVLNIAEGAGKPSKKDFARYLGNSLGSINEVVAGLDLAKDEKLIPKDKFDELLEKAESLRNQLGSFYKKLKADN